MKHPCAKCDVKSDSEGCGRYPCFSLKRYLNHLANVQDRGCEVIEMGNVSTPLPCQLCLQEDSWRFYHCESPCGVLVKWYSEKARATVADSAREEHGHPDDDI